MTHDERMTLAIELNKQIAASKSAGQITTRGLITSDTISADEVAELVALYPDWAIGVAYYIGDLVAYQDGLYQCIQAHTSQADWAPDIVPALFTRKSPAGMIPDWVQPTGAHDAYNTGDRVMFEGQVWESLIDANTWSPTAYPAGWKLI